MDNLEYLCRQQWSLDHSPDHGLGVVLLHKKGELKLYAFVNTFIYFLTNMNLFLAATCSFVKELLPDVMLIKFLRLPNS